MWVDLLRIMDVYLQGRQVKVRDGRKTLFRNDAWFYDKALSHLFPDLFKMCEQPNIWVHHVNFDSSNVTFTR